MPNSDSSKRILTIGLPILAVLLWCRPHNGSTCTSRPHSRLPTLPTLLPGAERHRKRHQQSHDTRLQRHADGSVDYLPALATSRQLGQTPAVESDLQVVAHLLSHYRFAYDENPVGVDNFEITEQLLGANLMRIRFIAPDCPALRDNELVDRWDTPYRFHAVSGQQMDIRSAGADQNFWTEDDLEYSGSPKQLRLESSVQCDF